MKKLTSSFEIEHDLSLMLYCSDRHSIVLHERCDITREKENIFFPIREVVAREGQVTCRCRMDDLKVSTSRKPVWCEFTLKEQLKIHEAVKQEYYQRKYGDFAYRLDETAMLLRSSLIKMARRGEKVKFTESEAPRFYHEGAWREVTELQFPEDLQHGIMAGWHDDRCLGKGVNSHMNLCCLPMECQRDFFLLMARRRAVSHI